MARPICFRWLVQVIRLAASRIFWTAGRSRPIRMAMMAMTTRSSIRVKAELERAGGTRDIWALLTTTPERSNENKMNVTTGDTAGQRKAGHRVGKLGAAVLANR